jgi:hypothetical protein
MERACTLSVNQHATVNVTVQILQGVLMSFFTSIKIDEDDWVDPSLPHSFRMEDRPNASGVLLRISISTDELTRINSVDEIIEIFRRAGFQGWPGRDDFSLQPGLHHTLILNDQDHMNHFVILKSDDTESLFKAQILRDDRNALRLPTEYVLLEKKSVAIIGAGSLGSKVAVSLVRSGIRKILLIDPDVMLPGNVIRHALDWRSVGFHKVKALRDELQALMPAVEVEVEEVLVAGQESNTVMARVIEKMAKYDLLVDATADSKVFNLLAALAIRADIPLVWGEVYAGGIGGLVARSRPGVGPDPLMIRNTYLKYCQEHEAPEYLLNKMDYSTGGDHPMVACDADVSVIAYHVVRLILDLLTEQQESSFPEDLYLIGLQRGWIFDSPFQNHAIHVEGRQSTPVISEMEGFSSQETSNEWTTFMKTLLDRDKHADLDAE